MTLLEVDQVVVLEPHGDLREGTECDDLERALTALAGQGRRVVADLSATHVLSARGLGILAAAQRAASRHGGRIAICGANRFERWLLVKARLSEVLSIHDSRASALRHLAQASGAGM